MKRTRNVVPVPPAAGQFHQGPTSLGGLPPPEPPAPGRVYTRRAARRAGNIQCMRGVRGALFLYFGVEVGVAIALFLLFYLPYYYKH